MSNITTEQRQFLNELQESGEMNMFGAAPVLQEMYGLDRKEAKRVLAHWIKTFGEKEPSLDTGPRGENGLPVSTTLP